MGRLEKIVVLTVLFLVAVVLGVALNSDSPGRTAQGAADDKSATSPLGDQAGPGGVLTAPAEKLPAESVAPDARPKEAHVAAPSLPETLPVSVPNVTPTVSSNPTPAPFILTLDGLTPSSAPDMMFYTWKSGDTLAGLAQRYYGSTDKLSRLQKSNEGSSDASLKIGDQLWIQVKPASANVSAGSPGAQLYVVQKGDVLSAISQKFYGTSKKWQKILDANQELLTSPERLKPGMKLKIPE